jgi:hypothetical protein
MAGYVSIGTIVPCHDEATFHEMVQRYLHVLVSLGVGQATLVSWGRHLPWPQPEEEHVAYEWPSLWGEAGEASFEIRLLVLLWGDREQWKHVSLELLFDIEEAIGPGAPIHPELIWYTRPFGQLAWRLMQAISAQVLGYGCYLADEASDTELLNLLDGRPGHFWWPSLIIAPRAVYEHYLPTSEQTAVKRQDDIGIFANRAHWEILPWER